MKIIQYTNWQKNSLDYLFMLEQREELYTRIEDGDLKIKIKRHIAWEFVNEILSVPRR